MSILLQLDKLMGVFLQKLNRLCTLAIQDFEIRTTFCDGVVINYVFEGVHVICNGLQSKFYYTVIEPSTGHILERRVFFTDVPAFVGMKDPITLQVAPEVSLLLRLNSKLAITLFSVLLKIPFWGFSWMYPNETLLLELKLLFLYSVQVSVNIDLC